MVNLADIKTVATEPAENAKEWLESADSAVDFVTTNANSDEVILYSGTDCLYMNAVLVPIKNVTPPDLDDLIDAHIFPDTSWVLEHEWGGGTSEKMYLADPLSSTGSKSLEGGFKLVFWRSFSGIDAGPPKPELSQVLVHALQLHWLDEKQAYCKLDDEGDIEPVIRLIDTSSLSEEGYRTTVTIKASHLHKFMAVTETALVIKFDFTRVRRKQFSGWAGQEQTSQHYQDLAFNTGRQPYASYANGVYVMRTVLTKSMLIEEENRRRSGTDKKYATFKAFDWKNKRIIETSCAPSATSSYFEKDSPLPFQITPAFFKSTVLQKYKADPEKYTLARRSISSRAGWELKTYDVNEAGQVHTYLRYLANLPYSEQLYWQSFNELPKGPISERAYKTDFRGEWDTTYDPLSSLMRSVSNLNSEPPPWWKKRPDELVETLHYPVSTSPEEWANAILILDQYLVEGFLVKPIKALLDEQNAPYDPNWRSLKLIEALAVALGYSEDQTKEALDPLRTLHFLRTKVKGHHAGDEKKTLITNSRKNFGSLAEHFRHLASECDTALNYVLKIFEWSPSQ